MRQQTITEPQISNFKVPPIIQDGKFYQFKLKLLGTLTGLSTIGHYEWQDKTQQKKSRTIVTSIAMYVLVPALITIPNLIIIQMKLHALAVLIPGIISPILSLLADLVLSKNKLRQRYVKYIATAVFGYLWGAHFFIARQLILFSLISQSVYTVILICSVISVLTSSLTISFAPVRQFSASALHYQQFSLYSTLYIRLFVPLPLLLTEIAALYSPFFQHSYIILPYLSFIVSLSFVLWIFGWISSLYNTVMFEVNNLLNCLVFGEQFTHSGQNYRSNHIWWANFLTLGLNILAIGLNILLVKSQQAQGRPSRQIVQNQHVFLVCAASATSLIIGASIYCNYRLRQQNKKLIRFGKLNFSQLKTKKDNDDSKIEETDTVKYFFGHRQVLMVVISFAVPLLIILLLLYVFTGFSSLDYTESQNTTPKTYTYKKPIIILFLSLNSAVYIIQSILKQLTRSRSKFGCSINLCCINKYKSQVELDMYMKLTLKVTGALAVLALILRMQNMDDVVRYILMVIPSDAKTYQQIYFFVQYILIPILIYRSYKRSQNFSNCFHMTIIVSLILTLTNFGEYYTIFVVLAMPNFSITPLKLLLVSPFTIPSKLLHKNQNCYRVIYLIINIFTLVVYIGTCGTFQLTMLFGLPIYWCVIPSINCQKPKKQVIKIYPSQIENKVSQSILQSTNSEILVEGKGTPEQNLYAKIISQVPFEVFRNKHPGYYLLRIGKYILLIQIVNSYYGFYQIVHLIGLEVQEVTTCHAKEGQTIDHMVDQTWGDNLKNRTCCAFGDTLKKIISGETHIKNAEITTQNQIKLVGVVQSQQFYELFKKSLIKSLIFYYDKFLKKAPNKELTSPQQKKAQNLFAQLQHNTSKSQIDKYFPYDFLQSNNFVFKAKLKQFSQKLGIKKKLPPLTKKNDKKASVAIIEDFIDLIGNSSTEFNTKTPNNDAQQFDSRQTTIANQLETSELNMIIIISSYLLVLDNSNYFNQERIYKILKKDPTIFQQFYFSQGVQFIHDAVGCALKIATGKHLLREQGVDYPDISKYDKNEYLGTMESVRYSKTDNNQQDVWGVVYNPQQRIMEVKRISKSDTSIYMFNLDNDAVTAVWNNLRFQLLYVANDNDERYSIQTHEHLLRNLLVEGCEEPYGYAGHYSEQFLNL